MENFCVQAVGIDLYYNVIYEVLNQANENLLDTGRRLVNFIMNDNTVFYTLLYQ